MSENKDILGTFTIFGNREYNASYIIKEKMW